MYLILHTSIITLQKPYLPPTQSCWIDSVSCWDLKWFQWKISDFEVKTSLKIALHRSARLLGRLLTESSRFSLWSITCNRWSKFFRVYLIEAVGLCRSLRLSRDYFDYPWTLFEASVLNCFSLSHAIWAFLLNYTLVFLQMLIYVFIMFFSLFTSP